MYHFLVLTLLEDYVGQKLHSFGVLAATLVITTAIAAASYEWLEKPFLNLKTRFELVPTRAA